MAIATRTEIKTLLQISVTDYDSLIDALIPIVQDEIVGYCNSHFAKDVYNDATNMVYEGADTISFTASTKKIADSADGFIFAAGQDIYITGSDYNDGHYTIVTADEDEMVVSETLIDELAGAYVSIKLVTFPKALKMIVADMIAYKINGKDAGVTSESVSGGVSLSFGQESGSYPQSLLSGLNKYRVVGFR